MLNVDATQYSFFVKVSFFHSRHACLLSLVCAPLEVAFNYRIFLNFYTYCWLLFYQMNEYGCFIVYLLPQMNHSHTSRRKKRRAKLAKVFEYTRPFPEIVGLHRTQMSRSQFIHSMSCSFASPNYAEK